MPFFGSENYETGVLTAACRVASAHPIIEQSDVNHASGGVRNSAVIKKSPGVNRRLYCIHSLTLYVCGGYLQDKMNYDNEIVPRAIDDQQLFEELRDICQKITSSAEKLSCSDSSNVNESLNVTMPSKAPKSRSYSTTASADFRFACSVGQNTSVKDTPKKLSRLSTCPLENTIHVMFQGPKKFYVKDYTDEDCCI